MLLVIWGHLMPDNRCFFIATSPFKIPLFFAITGIILNYQKTIKKFYCDLFFKLIVPWLTLSLLPVFVISFSKDIHFFIDSLIKILTGENFWYLPACIIANSVFYHICQFKNLRKITIGALVICSIGFLLAYNSIGNLFMLNRALIAQLYIYIGFIFKELILSKEHKSLKINAGLILAYLILLFICFYFYPDKNIDVHLNKYYNIPVNLLMIFTGCFTILMTARNFNISFKWLSFIGQNTLVFYIWHWYSILVSKALINYFIPNQAPVLLCFISSILILSFCSIIINRYFPYLAGKSHKTR